VVDTANNTVRQIVIATGQVSTLAGTVGSVGSTDGTGTAASFYEPNGITTDGTNLYVADTGNNTIRKIVIATGQVTTFAGTALVQGSGDLIGAAASFWAPLGITTDGINLYVTDSGNNTIRQIAIATGQVSTLAGLAGSALSTDNTGSLARFYGPYGITTDGANLYVADSGNSTIRQIAITTAQVTTLAGTPGMPGSVDGKGSVARFQNPRGITSDGTNLYVTDTVNSTVRQVVIATGQVTTVAGTAKGYADGTGAMAGFNWPEGVTTDGKNLYVSDTANNMIRRIQ